MQPRNRIGIDVGGTKIERIVFSASSEILDRSRVATPRGDYEATVDSICELIQSAVKKYGNSTVGICIPGSISPQTGLVRGSNSSWCNGKNLKQDISNKINQKVRMQNDANCLALSEAIDGVGTDYTNVFAVIIGSGVGGGIAIDKKVLKGKNLIAGEWGHNSLPWITQEEKAHSTDCFCGKNDCIETFISGIGFTHTTNKQYQTNFENSKEVIQQAKNGNAEARQACDDYLHRLAKSLAMVINIIDPDVIVLGGGMSNWQEIYKQLPQLIEPWIFADYSQTPILQAQHGDSSGVRGASWLWN